MKNLSFRTNMKLDPIEKDILKELLKTLTKQNLEGFYIDVIAHRSEKIKVIAADYNIKPSWAQTAYSIGMKLIHEKSLKFARNNRVKKKRLTFTVGEGAL